MWKINHFLYHFVAARVHLVLCTFCTCETEQATLIRLGLWPGSPRRPQTAISLALMRLMSMLQLECGVSVRGICSAIQGAFPSTQVDVTRMWNCVSSLGITLLVYCKLLFLLHFRCLTSTAFSLKNATKNSGTGSFSRQPALFWHQVWLMLPSVPCVQR